MEESEARAKRVLSLIGEKAATLEVRATSSLAVFNISERNGREFKLVTVNKDIPYQLVALASEAIAWSGVCKTEKRLAEVVNLARIECARSVYCRVMMQAFYDACNQSGSGDFFSGVHTVSDDAINAAIQAVDCERFVDGDAVCKDTSLGPFMGEGLTRCLAFFSQSYDRSEKKHGYEMRSPGKEVMPRITWPELLAGLAVVFLDAACAKPDKGLSLVAEAAQALMAAGYSQGVEDVYTARAQSAADARHVGNRKKREEAIDRFNTGSFRSKNEAASILAQEFGVGWQTARDWLKQSKSPKTFKRCRAR